MIIGTVNTDYVIFLIDESTGASQDMVDQIVESLYLEARLRQKGIFLDDYADSNDM